MIPWEKGMVRSDVVQAVPGIRLGAFAGVFLVMAAWERLAPRRKPTARKAQRWASNLELVALNNALLSLIAPLGAVGIALFVQARGWGLLSLVAWPIWSKVAICVIFMDLVIYLQHVMFHAVPLFWRLHMVHHADLDIDVTTGVRFHTLEIVLSLGIKAAAILVLGAPPKGVLLFEILLNATAMFSHSNIRIPLWLDRIARLIVVTPDMHRVHHSIVKSETNSNFGFNLPWWDRILGTYRDQPAGGHVSMAIGLQELRDEKQADRLYYLLLMPFTGQH